MTQDRDTLPNCPRCNQENPEDIFECHDCHEAFCPDCGNEDAMLCAECWDKEKEK